MGSSECQRAKTAGLPETPLPAPRPRRVRGCMCTSTTERATTTSAGHPWPVCAFSKSNLKTEFSPNASLKHFTCQPLARCMRASLGSTFYALAGRCFINSPSRAPTPKPGTSPGVGAWGIPHSKNLRGSSQRSQNTEATGEGRNLRPQSVCDQLRQPRTRLPGRKNGSLFKGSEV